MTIALEMKEKTERFARHITSRIHSRLRQLKANRKLARTVKRERWKYENSVKKMKEKNEPVELGVLPCNSSEN